MENTEVMAGDHSVQIKIYTDDRKGIHRASSKHYAKLAGEI